MIPAFNEAETLDRVVVGAKAAGLRCMVVDDGSTDHSVQTAEAAGADVVVRHPANRGYEAALGTGLRAAGARPGCRWTVSLDADGQLDPVEALHLVHDAEAAGAAIAVGIRPQPARFSEWIASRLLYALVGIRDPLCGLKAYRVDVVRKFPDSCGRRVGMELAVRAVRGGYALAQANVSMEPRPKHGSRYGRGLAAEVRIVGAAMALVPMAFGEGDA